MFVVLLHEHFHFQNAVLVVESYADVGLIVLDENFFVAPVAKGFLVETQNFCNRFGGVKTCREKSDRCNRFLKIS